MPNYRVLVSGEGFSMPWKGHEQVCGFRVLCHVWATDPAVAANIAAQVVRSAPELLAAIDGPLPSSAPVFIEEIDQAPPGDRQVTVSAFRFFPLASEDDWRPFTALER